MFYNHKEVSKIEYTHNIRAGNFAAIVHFLYTVQKQKLHPPQEYEMFVVKGEVGPFRHVGEYNPTRREKNAFLKETWSHVRDQSHLKSGKCNSNSNTYALLTYHSIGTTSLFPNRTALTRSPAGSNVNGIFVCPKDQVATELEDGPLPKTKRNIELHRFETGDIYDAAIFATKPMLPTKRRYSYWEVELVQNGKWRPITCPGDIHDIDICANALPAVS